MEKRTPHCKLSVVKALIDAGKIRTTASAVAGGEQLGFDSAEIVAVVMALTPILLQEYDDARRPYDLAGCL